MKTKTIQSILALALSCGILAAAPAQKRPSIPPAVADAVTHHTASVGGQSIAYTARAGTITLKNAKEEVTARLFYVAYSKDGTEARHRPVTFFYNGGPGSASIWLHMGSFSPVKVVTTNGAPTGPAPYTLINNQYSLLDKTDMVFVDAPNTGFSRVLGFGDPKDFMGVDEDGRAFTQFIQRYITQFGRWGSPKFLFGESYGTTRDCVLVNMLQRSGVQINGVVLLSSILNFGLGGLGGGQPISGGDWGYVLYLPTEAATAWYHHKAGRGQSLSVFLKGVEQFASGQYLHDLAQGDDLSPGEYDVVVSRLHDYL
ncbi:MAG: peptidase S10, partial [Candidatus Eremiobacteraeota bacterium]|nr:peptidase S10 [Candidatus Eremiobacteraeota bacterium]